MLVEQRVDPIYSLMNSPEAAALLNFLNYNLAQINLGYLMTAGLVNQVINIFNDISNFFAVHSVL